LLSGILKGRRELPFRVRACWERRHLGVPVSTTHTITGSIIGVGAAPRVSSVRWNVTYNIVFAWIIPASAGIAALFYWLAALFR
jgi:PiT family inorganic phosphate transporter